jgi:hypothetical protein
MAANSGTVDEYVGSTRTSHRLCRCRSLCGIAPVWPFLVRSVAEKKGDAKDLIVIHADAAAARRVDSQRLA